MRKYRCSYYVNYDEAGEFEFYSNHRAGSKDNKKDCLNHYRKNYGRDNIEIRQINLV